MVTYYDDEKNVESYISMAEGYDGALLIDALREYLPEKSCVLELGMGPGKDLLLLSEHFSVTGSDYSAIFVERFKKQHPSADVMQLNAVTLDTDKTFDAIYSNKVLYHLTGDDLRTSFQNQARLLNNGGIALHSFWYGDTTENMHGLHFAYYTDTTLRDYIGAEYEILTIKRYTEMDDDDSLYVILKKKA